MLVGNRSVLHKSPGRFLSGTVASIDRSAFSKAGMMRGAHFSLLAGVPNGHLAPSAWMLPRKGGAMSSVNFAGLSLSAVGAGVLGLPGHGEAAFSIVFADAAGQLIVSGAGSALMLFATNAPLLTASIGGYGSASFTIGSAGLLGAKASGTGAANFTISVTLTPAAVGHMAGSTEGSALTEASIAAAVWGRAIEAGYTADQILRLLAAHAAGAATGLEGANPQFVGLDGTTVRIDGAYSSGNRTIDALRGD